MSTPHITRRTVLKALAATGAASLLGGCQNDDHSSVAESAPVLPQFVQPPVRTAGAAGLLDTTLVTKFASSTLNGKPITIRTYDGMIGGPTLRCRPGQTLRIKIDNQLPANTRLQWTDAAAEEVFARVYEASTVRSRNFRVWVVGQALAPVAATSAITNKAPEVLAEVRKVFTLFADPGQRASDGTIDPKLSHPTVIHEREF